VPASRHVSLFFIGTPSTRADHATANRDEASLGVRPATIVRG
jgi:hypothetical protein